MKINYETHPFLLNLKEGNLMNIKVCDEDMDHIFPINSDFVKKINIYRNIEFISDSFQETVINNNDEISISLNNNVNDMNFEFKYDGTIIIKNTVYCINIDKSLNKELKIKCFVFTTNGEFAFYTGDAFSHTSVKYENNDFMQLIGSVVSVLYFKQYATVETKVLLPKNKIKNVPKIANYQENDTDFNITYTGKDWCENKVIREAFQVRGFFRQQPYGIGRKLTKTIWIEGFEKRGYAKLAGRIKQQI